MGISTPLLRLRLQKNNVPRRTLRCRYQSQDLQSLSVLDHCSISRKPSSKASVYGLTSYRRCLDAIGFKKGTRRSCSMLVCLPASSQQRGEQGNMAGPALCVKTIKVVPSPFKLSQESSWRQSSSSPISSTTIATSSSPKDLGTPLSQPCYCTGKKTISVPNWR